MIWFLVFFVFLEVFFGFNDKNKHVLHCFFKCYFTKGVINHPSLSFFGDCFGFLFQARNGKSFTALMAKDTDGLGLCGAMKWSKWPKRNKGSNALHSKGAAFITTVARLSILQALETLLGCERAHDLSGLNPASLDEAWIGWVPGAHQDNWHLSARDTCPSSLVARHISWQQNGLAQAFDCGMIPP